MFNVYPVEIRYTRTDLEGVLAGIPCKCTFGVGNEVIGRKVFDKLIKANPNTTFSDLEIIKK